MFRSMIKFGTNKSSSKHKCVSGQHWGDEKEVLKVLKLDPIFIPLFKKQQVNYSLIISLRSLLRFIND
jgi:hypothetical protein